MLHAVGGANERLVMSLALDDVHRFLRAAGRHDPVGEGDLMSAPDQLRMWRLIDADQNDGEQHRTARSGLIMRSELRTELSREPTAAAALPSPRGPTPTGQARA